MTCPSGTDDGAYVLGALSPRERLDFERHLTGCAACTAAVGDLAGLPGLLARIDPADLEPDAPVPAVPRTLLPALTQEVERGSRVGRRRLASLTAVAAALATVVVTTTLDALLDGDAAPPGAAPPGVSGPVDPSGAVLPLRPMSPVGEVPVRATVTLEPVAWGTRLRLDCTYDTDSVDFELPRRVDYYLYVRSSDGRAERIGSWQSVDGATTSLDASTATPAEDIDSVEVRAPDGRVVLTLAV